MSKQPSVQFNPSFKELELLRSVNFQANHLLLDEPNEHTLCITLNRPDSGNALCTEMGSELHSVFQMLIAHRYAYRCVILTAAGQKIFCAGADLKERNSFSTQEFREQHYLFERMVRSIWECPVPVIAALNGHTMAGGLEIALNCDFIYAADHAKFGFPEVRRGIMPGGSGTQLLPRKIGDARARELILTGITFSADEALRWGLVNRLCNVDDLLPESLSVAARICENAPLAVFQAKKSMTHGLQMDARTAMLFEAEAYDRLLDTEDRQEGIKAFVEKRVAVFKGH